MNVVQLYGLKNCSTCVKAMKWLEGKKIEFAFTDYRDHPVAPEQLTAWALALGGWDKLVNRASTAWRNLSDERKIASSAEQWLALIAESPTLIKRPVSVTLAGIVNVGFSEKKYGEIFA